jgi:hypothetical protein
MDLVAVYKAPSLPMHWIAADGASVYAVPAHVNGWAKRKPLPALPIDAQAISLAAHGMILRTVVCIPC